MERLVMKVDTAVTVPVNYLALTDDTDFKSKEESIVFNQAGLDLVWNFVTPDGVQTQVAVTPTDTAGDYDWVNKGNAIYNIEIPASGGASINNDTIGSGWFTGICDGVLHWASPTVVFLPANIVDSMVNGTDYLQVDTIQVSGDAVAADNLESQYDGTGIVGDNFPATQAQLSNIANTGAAINKVVAGGTVNTGSQVNTYVATRILDGTYHEITSAGGVIDVDYNFNIGGSGIPVSVTMIGRLYDPPATVDAIIIQAYNWVTLGYEQVGIWDGVNSAVDSPKTVILFSSHVGTGTDSGEVDIKFTQTGLGAGTILYLDLLYCSYSVVSSSVGYANGSLWLDTNASNTNTVRGIDGTADNPVSTIAAIITLAGTTNLKRVTVSPQSSFAFPSDMTGYQFTGNGYSIDFNGQNSDSLLVEGATVSGLLTSSTGIGLLQCRLADGVTLPNGGYGDCVLPGDVNLSGTFYMFNNCVSAVAGGGSPSIDFGAVGAQGVNFRNYSGGIHIKNMKAGDNMSLEGDGQFIVDVNCTGGEIHVRGSFKKTDNSAGAVLIEEVANIKTNTIHDGYTRASTVNTIQLATSASSVDGAYDPAGIFIVAGTGAGQSRSIFQYVGSTRIAVVDRDWKVQPDTTSEYRIMFDAGRISVNEGLAQSGSTTSTIKLNALASSSDNAYKNQLCFIRSGTGEDQVALIASYVGATKIATLEDGVTWAVIPDDTSAYMMVPAHTHTLLETSASLWDYLTSAMSTVGSIGKKFADWVLGADSKVLLSTDAQTGAVIPTVSTITDGAKASVCTEGRLAELDAANLPANIDTILTRIVGTLAAGTHTAQSGDAYTRIGAAGAGLTVLATLAAQSTMQTDVTAIKAKTDNQPAGIPKNVALPNFGFEMVDSTDHVTPETGLTVTAQILKDSGSYVTCTNSATITEKGSGTYSLDLTQAEMNADIVYLKFTATGADQKIVILITS